MITYGVSINDSELQQILDLQARNLSQNISPEESSSQGFVTVHHDFGLLKRMNSPYPHIVARDGNKIAGYALVMLRSFQTEIPVLFEMFRQIDATVHHGQKLGEAKYFIMGQVCVDKPYRGKGVFAGLYQEMARRMSPHFAYIITEVARSNPRSMRAHEKVGFEKIHNYVDGEHWEVLLLDIGQNR
ncbi:MAG: GNAT family N-acetyltransferase [Bacteroidota bacterium]